MKKTELTIGPDASDIPTDRRSRQVLFFYLRFYIRCGTYEYQ